MFLWGKHIENFVQGKSLNVILNRLNPGLVQRFYIFEKYLTAVPFVSSQKTARISLNKSGILISMSELN